MHLPIGFKECSTLGAEGMSEGPTYWDKKRPYSDWGAPNFGSEVTAKSLSWCRKHWKHNTH